MKNKEIEELLNELKEYASGGMNGLYPSEDTVKNFVSYIEQLEKENGLQKERIAYLERSNNRREDTIISLQDELIDMETNKDNAIEMLETYKRMLSLYSQRVGIFDLQDVIDELKGDSDE